MWKSARIPIVALAALFCLIRPAPAQETEYASVIADEAARQNSALDKCPEDQANCSGKLVPKIINGKEAQLGAFGWVVSIGRRAAEGSNGHECGGTLISDRFILTAAHCFSDKAKPDYFRVQAGTIKLGSYKTAAVVKRILIHPLFERKTSSFDVALVEMETPFVAGPALKWIDIQDDQGFIASGHESEDRKVVYTLTGFGSTWHGGSESNKLMYSDNIPSLTSAICRDLVYWGKPVFGDAMKDNMICAGDTNNDDGSDACKGDSGGGLIYYPTTATPVVAGIASRGAQKDGTFDCTRQALRVGVYTRVSAYADSIKACVEGSGLCDFVAPGQQQSASKQ
ncbi:secreted trypsin-like serine protease [Rhizobium leguminosarum]|uniref:Secreted trypsin-like serine protease n=1 Tax=Rhizobium leguminosarum TaxID=384 RepID=A0A7Z0E0Z8_RHILE|nr:serine protease [Rhizobium leguminosarum]NYJ13038.1 secreted trypsin-like serine protease [Rhizobium leguminosarum]